MNQKIEKVMSEWEPLKVEYALPNSTVPITDLWTVAYDMSETIKELAEREAAMIKAFERLLEEFLPYSSCNKRGQPKNMWRIKLDNFFGYSNRRDAGAFLIWDNARKALSEFKQENPSTLKE